MLYAIHEGARCLAKPSLHGTCPMCHGPVLTKCGQIKVWHWAHETETACDYEPETPWHLNWKMRFPEACREVVMEDTTEKCRVDAVYEKTAFEFQQTLVADSLMQRTSTILHFGLRPFWVLNGIGIQDHFIFTPYQIKNHFSFRWKYPKRSMSVLMNFPFGIDFGDHLFLVRKIHWDSPKVAGWGERIEQGQEFFPSVNHSLQGKLWP